MSRLFSIIVTLFILVLVYLWIGHITGRDDTAESPEPSQIKTEVTNNTPEDLRTEDRDLPRADDIMTEEQTTESSEAQEEPVQPPIEKPPVRSSSKGDHLVIVGNFLELDNAEKHLATVKGLGYTEAEILQFEISQYYTVCASRYNNPTEARRAAKRIKEQHGIDAYMRTVN